MEGFKYKDDDQIADWVKDDIYLIRRLGLMVGDDGYFYPKARMTREEEGSVIAKLYRWITFKVPNMIQRVKKSIIVITNTHDGRTSLGSGTIIGKDGYILTNFHCVSTIDEIGRMTRQGKITVRVLSDPSSTTIEGTTSYDAEFIAGSAFDDLAIVKIDTGYELPILEIAKDNPFEGEPIQVFGHPLALEYTTSAGQITQDLRMVAFRAMLQTDAAINPGNSGGAAVSEISEKLVGVPTLKRMDGEAIAYLVPPRTIHTFLINNKVNLQI